MSISLKPLRDIKKTIKTPVDGISPLGLRSNSRTMAFCEQAHTAIALAFLHLPSSGYPIVRKNLALRAKKPSCAWIVILVFLFESANVCIDIGGYRHRDGGSLLATRFMSMADWSTTCLHFQKGFSGFWSFQLKWRRTFFVRFLCGFNKIEEDSC